jgi:hypothetical protein
LTIFYENYKSILETNKFKPQFIWNCDETMLDFSQQKEKVLCLEKNVVPATPTATMDEHITLLLFVSAAGSWLKPLAIFPLQHLPPLAPELMMKFNFAGQKNGWIDMEIFKNIVEIGFVKEMDTLRAQSGACNEPVLLLCDGHSSRFGLDAKMLWEQHNIMVYLLPSHSSAVTQPLDLSVNGEFKKTLAKRFIAEKHENGQERRNRLLHITHRCLSRVNNEDTILNGWERSGLWPFNIEIPFRSTMIVDTTPPISPSTSKMKRKRGPDISHGKVLYSEMR